MKLLQDQMQMKFDHHLIERLREIVPEKTGALPPKALQLLVRNGIEIARSYDIKKAADVERLLLYLLDFGTNFGKTPETAWAGAILTRKYLDSTEKMDKIDEFATFVLR